jgi:hypothetical protein
VAKLSPPVLFTPRPKTPSSTSKRVVVVVVVLVGKTTLLLRAPSLLLLFPSSVGEIETPFTSFLPWTLFFATRLPGQCFSLSVEDDDDDDGSQRSPCEIQYCLSFSRLSLLRDLVVTGGAGRKVKSVEEFSLYKFHKKRHAGMRVSVLL